MGGKKKKGKGKGKKGKKKADDGAAAAAQAERMTYDFDVFAAKKHISQLYVCGCRCTRSGLLLACFLLLCW